MRVGPRVPILAAGAPALMVLASVVLASVALASVAPAVEPAPHPLLGSGWGVDHVGVGVRDLPKAQRDFERLGFKVSPGGRFPSGAFNSIIGFRDLTYLELLSFRRSPGGPSPKDDAADVADFVSKHDGAMFLGLNVSSARAAASYLKAHDFDVDGPVPGGRMREGETKQPAPQWYLVSVADKPGPNKRESSLPVFFIEYVAGDHADRTRGQGRAEHPNTAMGLRAVWFAVHDPRAELGALRAAGFQAGESRESRLLGARGREVKAGSGAMILLETSRRAGALRRYMAEYQEGIFAVSVEVSDLSVARSMAESAAGGTVRTYRGAYGLSFLLPPGMTHGMWVEMFQRRGTSPHSARIPQTGNASGRRH